DVAAVVDRHAEVDLLVGEVRIVPPEVPIDAGRAQYKAGLPERYRVVSREEPDALRALEPDLVAVEQRQVVVERVRHPLDEAACLGIEAGGDVLRAPPGL